MSIINLKFNQIAKVGDLNQFRNDYKTLHFAPHPN